jgi:hypothetical protein
MTPAPGIAILPIWLDPAVFSGHSLRLGFVTSALEHGADIFKVIGSSESGDAQRGPASGRPDRRNGCWRGCRPDLALRTLVAHGDDLSLLLYGPGQDADRPP